MLDLEEKLKLWPGLYDTQVDSNIYKIMQVVVEQLGEMDDIFKQVTDLTDINNVSGANLDLRGADFKVNRDGRTDEDFRAFIAAKMMNFIDGNTINNIINYFSFFVDIDDIILTELFLVEVGLFFDATRLLDGNTLLSGAPLFQPAGFNVETGTITPEQEAAFLLALDTLRSAGVLGVLNQIPP